MRAFVVVVLAAALACLSSGAAVADDSVAVSFRSQGGVPHHSEAASAPTVRGPAAVLGIDERERVDDTTLFPYSAISLLTTFRGLDELQCTGTFVGEDVLITAAHCLWDSQDGFVEDVLVRPGKDGFGADGEPFGSEYAFDWAVPQEYIDHNGTDSAWDFGVVVMTDGDLGNTVGWLTLANLQTPTLVRPDFQPAIIGYPYDLGDGEQMWEATKPDLLNVEDFLLYYDIDTGGGQSGSAIVSLNPSAYFSLMIVGIHTTGVADQYNFGSRIDAEFIETVLAMCDLIGCTAAHYTEAFTQGLFWTDADCDSSLSTRDNQAMLRVILSQAPLIQTEPCPNVGTAASISGFGDLLWADADCDGNLTPRDNQSLLRKILLQPALSQTQPCPALGAAVTLD